MSQFIQNISCPCHVDAESDAFIYGGQALNTVELAKQDIRGVLQRRRLYTYSPDYWSLTFEPEDSVVQQRNMELRDIDKSKWFAPPLEVS